MLKQYPPGCCSCCAVCLLLCSRCAPLSPPSVPSLQVVRILKQYPVGRLVVFGYVLGVHLFIYVLLQRLQRRALIEDHTGVS